MRRKQHEGIMTDKGSRKQTQGDETVSILIADGNAKTRSALRLLIEQQSGLEVAGEATDSESLVESLLDTQAQLLLVDWELPGLQTTELEEMDGRATLSGLKALTPDLKVVALSGRPEKSNEALAAGADVFVSKGESPRGLASILRSFAVNARRERAGHANK